MVENVGVVDSVEQSIFLWETHQRKLVAVLNAGDDQSEGVLNIHPAYHSRELEEEMINVGEQYLKVQDQPFHVFVHSQHLSREVVLKYLGYRKGNGLPEHQWRRDLHLPLPEIVLPDGYNVRPIGDVGSGDWQRRSWVSWRAFHPNDPDEDYQGWEWSLNWKRSPLYRCDLDIVATAPNNDIVAYCVLWYDDVTRSALFDPVAVMPEFQRLGLGRAILHAALHQGKRMGATLVNVGGYTESANGLYRSALSSDFDLNTPWVKG